MIYEVLKAPNEKNTKMQGFNVAVQLTKRSIIIQDPMYNMNLLFFYYFEYFNSIETVFAHSTVHAFGFGRLFKYESL